MWSAPDAERVAMPSWLVDDPSLVFLALAVLALVLGTCWWRTRRRGYLIGLGAVAVLCGLVWLLAHFTDTDSKQIERSLRAMVRGVNHRNLDQVFEHVANDFRFGGANKAEFRKWAEGYLNSGGEVNLDVWDFQPREISRPNRSATVVFKVKARNPMTSGIEFYNCRARFTLDPDGQWRLKGFQLFPPQTDPDTGEALEVHF
jgi:hypothetical protein